MSRNILLMLRKVSLYDSIIGIVITILIYAMSSNYVLPLFIGLVVTIINFLLSSTITELLFTKCKGKYMPMYLLSFILRITLISLIGFVFFANNKYYILAYIGGYMVHLFGISIYSLSQKHVS